MNRFRGVSCGATALATLLGNVGMANAAEPAATKGALEEIIVTAQKRGRCQEVPISLYALSGETLERQGITNIQERQYAGRRKHQFRSGPDESVDRVPPTSGERVVGQRLLPDETPM
jgi:glutamate formiminotransferase